MSLAHLVWSSTLSTLRPITFAPRCANCDSRLATAPSSVVHTGVKSFGCENSTAQLSPIQSWKSIVPWVVFAVKFGAMSLMRNDMTCSLVDKVNVGCGGAIIGPPTRVANDMFGGSKEERGSNRASKLAVRGQVEAE